MPKKLFLLIILFFSTTTFAALPQPFLNTIPEPERDYAYFLPKLAKMKGPKGDFFRLKLAEKYIKEGKSSMALRSVVKVKEPIFKFWRQVLMAKIYLDKNKIREALALLRTLPDKPDYELFFGEGLYDNLYQRALITRYLAKKKLNRNAKTEAADLISLYPLDKNVEKIIVEEDKDPKLTREQKIDKLHALHSRYKYKAIAGLMTVSDIKKAKISNEEKCRAFFELGNASRHSKNYRDVGAQSLREVTTSNCGDYFIPRALYRLGYYNNNSDHNGLRKQYLTRLYKNYPGHRLADDAVYKLYKIANKEGNSAQAKKYFNQLMGLEKGDMKSVLLFEMAYPYYKKEKYKKAATIFAKALNTESTADESYPQLLYWYARSLEKTENKKDVDKAKQTYKRLAKDYPYSFYAILAAKRSGTKINVPDLPELEGTPPPNDTEYFALIDELNKDRYHEGARAVLEFVLHKNPKWQDTHTEYISKKLIESQNYRKAIDLASKHFESGVYGPISSEKKEPMFAAFYPTAFKTKTEIGYKKSDLPLGAIEGIMREESLFQRTARSWVGATGLMQLMPSTAAMVKKSLPEVNFSSNLEDPESNIILGSTYLKRMRNYFQGQLPLAIMAYNAGPGNVNKWLRKFGELELDEFIEKIPLSETRNYVKRVMRTMQVYGGLYNEPFFDQPTYFSFKIERTERQKPKAKRKKKKRHRTRK